MLLTAATGKHRRGRRRRRRRQRIRLEHGRRDRHVDKRAAAPPSQISSSSPSRRHRLPSKSLLLLLLLKVFACIFGRVNSTKKEGTKKKETFIFRVSKLIFHTLNQKEGRKGGGTFIRLQNLAFTLRLYWRRHTESHHSRGEKRLLLSRIVREEEEEEG